MFKDFHILIDGLILSKTQMDLFQKYFYSIEKCAKHTYTPQKTPKSLDVRNCMTTLQ